MPAQTAATHFTPSLFTFLRQLARNNDREWFNANKPRYVRQVRDPMLRFIEDVGPKLARVSRQVVADPRPVGGSMFRIYRDTRFSHDKTPYKTSCSAQFRHVLAADVHAPGFYLHLAPGEVFVGSGIWRPHGDGLRRIRQAIVDDPARWKRLIGGKAFTTGPLSLAGDSLKRAPRDFDADHPLIEHIRRKDFITVATLDEKTACRDDFIDEFVSICRQSKPFVKFLADAVGVEL